MVGEGGGGRGGGSRRLLGIGAAARRTPDRPRKHQEQITKIPVTLQRCAGKDASRDCWIAYSWCGARLSVGLLVIVLLLWLMWAEDGIQSFPHAARTTLYIYVDMYTLSGVFTLFMRVCICTPVLNIADAVFECLPLRPRLVQPVCKCCYAHFMLFTLAEKSSNDLLDELLW